MSQVRTELKMSIKNDVLLFSNILISHLLLIVSTTGRRQGRVKVLLVQLFRLVLVVVLLAAAAVVFRICLYEGIMNTQGV